MPLNPLVGDELDRAHRWFAVDANNRAWRLAEQPTRTPTEDDEMLDCAHSAALHWRHFGNPLNDARAQMLLGHVHALLHDGERALRYATASHAYLSSIDTPGWEVAFMHAVLANAYAAAGRTREHAEHYAEARRAADAIAEPEERSMFDATFVRVPAP